VTKEGEDDLEQQEDRDQDQAEYDISFVTARRQVVCVPVNR
jgi:hypothetical protein